MGSMRDIRALETTERVLAALMTRGERDDAIERLIVAIARDRARLPGATIAVRAEAVRG